jgi:hypothetical protein
MRCRWLDLDKQPVVVRDDWLLSFSEPIRVDLT